MRLGIIGESLIERIIARTNAIPAPLIETQIAFSMARSIMAGVRLGIYEAIGAGATTPAGVAAACKTDPGATEKLMDTLVGCRYLRHRDGRYELTPKARKWLLRDSPRSIADKLLFQYDEWDIVAKYEEYVTTGQPLDVHGSLADAPAWDRYQRGMRAMASISAGPTATTRSARAAGTAHCGRRSSIFPRPSRRPHRSSLGRPWASGFATGRGTRSPTTWATAPGTSSSCRSWCTTSRTSRIAAS
jgi:hypothetical protein